MSSRFESKPPRLSYVAGIAVGLVVLAIIVGPRLPPGTVPIPNISLALVGEPTRTGTPIRTATPRPVVTATPIGTGVVAMTDGQHIYVSCAQTISLVVSNPSSDLSCLSAPVTLTPVPATTTPVATAVPSFIPIDTATDTPIVLPTDTSSVVITDTPTSTGVPSDTPSPTPSPSATSVSTPSVVATSTVLATGTAVVIAGPVHYVSKLGNNSDGNSWASAWNELASINWSVVRSGDTVVVDGGVSQMTYTTELIPKGSGFTIRLAPDAGRNGQVVIFGGRSTPLPYCQQVSYVYQTVGVRVTGVDMAGASGVVLDGTKWRGILITGSNFQGVDLSGSNNTVRYTEITDNGQANFTTGNNWRPDGPGVHPSGSGNRLDHNDIHDNGQDALQTGSAVSGLTITYDWHHNARTHPGYGPNIPFNYCMHSDGIQIYDGGTSSGITIDHSVIGPGHMQGTILGQTPGRALVNNVTISNSLFINDFNADIMGYGGTASQNWTLDHITTFMISYPGNYVSPLSGWSHAILVEGSGHKLTNSIVYGGDVSLPGGTQYANNCQFGLTGGNIGTNADPGFVRKPNNTSLQDSAAADFTVNNPACAGRGSSVTSVAMLLAS